MTLAQIVSWAALAVTAAVVLWRGRRPERLAISVVAIGWGLTRLVERRESWFVPQYGMMAIDGFILVVFVAMAFHYDRYWTIWVAAFQAVAELTHFAFLINPRALYRAYYYGNFSIGYLILGAILAGVIIERERPFRRRPRRRRALRSTPRPV
jgi:hypothetical protein